jgi:rare lipoprotein A
MKSVERGWTEKGIASWYGGKFQGRRTANGEVYDMNGVSAAHKTLPFDTRVRVDNLDNGQSMVVRINDRGPFIKGRIIDLSLGAAEQIDMVQAGVAEVRITVVEEPTPTILDGDFAGREYRIQVGAFLELSNAQALAADLDELYTGVEVSSDGRWHRVQIAGLTSSAKVQKTLEDLSRGGYDAVLVH